MWLLERGGAGAFFRIREAYILSFSLLLCLEPCKKFSVGGGWVVVGGWVVYSEFSVLLWSKALVLDLDQAEQCRLEWPLTSLPVDRPNTNRLERRTLVPKCLQALLAPLPGLLLTYLSPADALGIKSYL